MALAEALRAKLLEVSTATLTTQMLKRGFRNVYMRGVRPLHRGLPRMVGEATTLRCIPAREDLDSLEALGSTEHPQRKAIETIAAGHVLVVDCRGELGAAGVGAILIARLKARGAAGFVSDGGVRDAEEASALGLPVFAAGASAPPSVARHHAVAIDEPIGCGGVAVYPGDIVVGDGDGVVVLPAPLAGEVAEAGYEQERLEGFIMAEIQAGKPLFGTYPANAETLARYRARRDS